MSHRAEIVFLLADLPNGNRAQLVASQRQHFRMCRQVGGWVVEGGAQG